MKAIAELAPQVSTAAVCRSLGVPRATLYRRRRPTLPLPAPRPRPKPSRALNEQERQQVRDVLHSAPFVDKRLPRSTRRCWTKGSTCARSARCTASWINNRKSASAATNCDIPTYHKPELVATAPNQVWSWDITKLLGRRSGRTSTST